MFDETAPLGIELHGATYYFGGNPLLNPRPSSVGNTPNEIFEGAGHEIQFAGRPVNEALL